MKTLSIVNRTCAILVINLPHNLVPECAKKGAVGVRTHDASTGERTVVAVRKAISGAVTLLAKGGDGDRVDGLPLSARMAPDVRRLSASGSIEVIDVEATPAPLPAFTSNDSKPEAKKSKGA